MSIQNVVIFTMGTRGDVQPYVYLARALQRVGFKPVIATHPCWKTLVENAGVDFSPIGPDIDISYEAAVIRGKSVHWLMGAIKTMQFVFRIIAEGSDEIAELCQKNDLVISSHSHAGAIEAQAFRKPMISVTLQPDALSQPNKPRTKWQRITESITGMLLNPMMIGPYNKIRKKYNLTPVKSIDAIMSPYLNLIPISRYIAPQNPYWDETNHIVGFWYEEDDAFQPASELQRFLDAGSPPIIVALGAMSFESREEKEKLDILIHAFQQTGTRAIIQGFEKTLEGYELPENTIAVGSVPHSWLFSRGYCVIHHGGFGTTAAAILAEKPSIVIPHVLDQFLWADKVYELKAGMEPIKSSELNEEMLIERIDLLKATYDEIDVHVKALSKQMKEENGLQNAISLIQEVCESLPDNEF